MQTRSQRQTRASANVPNPAAFGIRTQMNSVALARGKSATWREVADLLGKDEAQVRRWERHLGRNGAGQAQPYPFRHGHKAFEELYESTHYKGLSSAEVELLRTSYLLSALKARAAAGLAKVAYHEAVVDSVIRGMSWEPKLNGAGLLKALFYAVSGKAAFLLGHEIDELVDSASARADRASVTLPNSREAQLLAVQMFQECRAILSKVPAALVKRNPMVIAQMEMNIVSGLHMAAEAGLIALTHSERQDLWKEGQRAAENQSAFLPEFAPIAFNALEFSSCLEDASACIRWAKHLLIIDPAFRALQGGASEPGVDLRLKPTFRYFVENIAPGIPEFDETNSSTLHQD